MVSYVMVRKFVHQLRKSAADIAILVTHSFYCWRCRTQRRDTILTPWRMLFIAPGQTLTFDREPILNLIALVAVPLGEQRYCLRACQTWGSRELSEVVEHNFFWYMPRSLCFQSCFPIFPTSTYNPIFVGRDYQFQVQWPCEVPLMSDFLNYRFSQSVRHAPCWIWNTIRNVIWTILKDSRSGRSRLIRCT